MRLISFRTALTAVRRVAGRIRRLADPQARLTRRVLAAKRARAAGTSAYVECPDLAFVIMGAATVPAASLSHLRRTEAQEIIVCDDAASARVTDRWRRRLTGPNEFLITSKNASPVQQWRRALGLSRGRFVCVLLDGRRKLPDGWADTALDLFTRHPTLAVLGFAFDTWIPFADPASGVPFMFVNSLEADAVLLRREVVLQRGWLEAASKQADAPNQRFEDVVCARTLAEGWQVALFGAVAMPAESGP